MSHGHGPHGKPGRRKSRHNRYFEHVRPARKDRHVARSSHGKYLTVAALAAHKETPRNAQQV